MPRLLVGPQVDLDSALCRCLFAQQNFVGTSRGVTNKMKYVNNADINSATPRDEADYQRDMVRIIELVFFAYRDFVAAPDEILSRLKFGRAHHRVLHFVNRNPGLPVADLLKVLRITKQSLARVLKELVDEGFVEQRTGPVDRRQRLLHTTRKGRDLALKLADLQAIQIDRALSAAGRQYRPVIETFLLSMVDQSESDMVRHFIGGDGFSGQGGAGKLARQA